MRALKVPLISLIGFAIAGVILNFSVNAYIQLTLLLVLINGIVAMSLNLVNGFTGQFSLGHAGFMAIGAYVSAYASKNITFIPESLNFIAFFIYAIAGGLLAAVAGFLVGQPSLRLRGDYLAIVTLGFGEIIRVILLNLDFLGGPRGIAGVPSVGPFMASFMFTGVWFLICLFSLWRLGRSRYGRSFLAVREDEIAAESMGVNTTRAKVLSFMISSFFAGVAGSLTAHVTQFISPASFSFLLSVNAVIMVVLGGMGSFSGSLLAALFITIVPELLRPLQDLTGVDLRMVIFSISLILVMILRPHGLFGEYEITDVYHILRKKYFGKKHA